MTSLENPAWTPVTPRTIGLIGLGSLGLPVAKNLIADGHTVIGYRRHDMTDFVEAGGTPASSPEDIAGECSLILLCLPDADALHDVVSGSRGLAAGARPGTVVADLGTFPIPQKERARQALTEHGVEMLDAPVSGTPGMVSARKAIVMASGPEAAVEASRPGLNGVGVARFVGEFGNGTKLKCIANTLVAINTAAAAEAMALAESVGLDLSMMIDVIGSGAGGSVMFSIRAPWMMQRDFVPARGSVATLCKDLSVIRHLAADSGSRMPMLTAATTLYELAAVSGRGEHDIATLVEVIEGVNDV